MKLFTMKPGLDIAYWISDNVVKNTQVNPPIYRHKFS